MYITAFSVRGPGAFPLDMLRYDNCYPQGSTDVDGIAEDGAAEERTIVLVQRHKNLKPYITKDRWISFRWPVQRIGQPRKL